MQFETKKKKTYMDLVSFQGSSKVDQIKGAFSSWLGLDSQNAETPIMSEEIIQIEEKDDLPMDDTFSGKSVPTKRKRPYDGEIVPRKKPSHIQTRKSLLNIDPIERSTLVKLKERMEMDRYFNSRIRYLSYFNRHTHHSKKVAKTGNYADASIQTAGIPQLSITKKKVALSDDRKNTLGIFSGEFEYDATDFVDHEKSSVSAGYKPAVSGLQFKSTEDGLKTDARAEDFIFKGKPSIAREQVVEPMKKPEVHIAPSAGFQFNNTTDGKADKSPSKPPLSLNEDKPAFSFSGKNEKPSFSFEKKNDIPKEPKEANGNFDNVESVKPLGAAESKPGFTFGNKNEGQNGNVAKPSGFSFGGNADSNAEKPKSSAFSFGGGEKAEKPAGLSFGEKSVSEKPSFAFGESNKPAFSFGDSKTPKDVVTATEQPEKPKFSFGKTTEKPSNEKPAFSFGSADSKEKKEPPAFSFGSTGQEENGDKPAFSFGSAGQKQSEDKPAFSFGSSKPKENNDTKPAFSFGSTQPNDNKNSTETKENKPFSFGSANGKPAFSAGSSQPPSGKPEEKDASKSFTFGKEKPFGDEKASEGVKPFGEGKRPFEVSGKQPSDKTEKPPSVPAFTFGTKESTPFAQPLEKATSEPFAFNPSSAPLNQPAKSEEPSTKRPAFSFNGAGSNTNPAFSFGASQPVTPFGAPQPSQASSDFSMTHKQSQSFAFGQQNNTPASNAGFSFNPSRSASPNFNFAGNQQLDPSSVFGGAAAAPSPLGQQPQQAFGAAPVTAPVLAPRRRLAQMRPRRR